MGVSEPGRSADMSNVAQTDSYAKTSAVSVEPAMTQAHTHTDYTWHTGRLCGADNLKLSHAEWPLSSPHIK